MLIAIIPCFICKSPLEVVVFSNFLNFRYFSLLGKHHRDDPELSPLPYVVKLLLKREVSRHVTSSIMDMVYNLLEEIDEEEEEVKVIEVNNMVSLSSAENVRGGYFSKETQRLRFKAPPPQTCILNWLIIFHICLA